MCTIDNTDYNTDYKIDNIDIIPSINLPQSKDLFLHFAYRLIGARNYAINNGIIVDGEENIRFEWYLYRKILEILYMAGVDSTMLVPKLYEQNLLQRIRNFELTRTQDCMDHIIMNIIGEIL